MSASDRRALLEALTIEFPKVPGEGSIHYAQRLNVLAGFIPREDATLIEPGEDLKAKGPRAEPAQTWLPYKDGGE